MRQGPLVAHSAARAQVSDGPISLEAIKELRGGDLVWLDRTALLRLSDQLGTPDLRLPLTFAVRQRNPLASTCACDGITDIDDRIPMPVTALTDVSLHLCFLLGDLTVNPRKSCSRCQSDHQLSG